MRHCISPWEVDTQPEPEPLPPPKDDALVQGTTNNYSPRRPPSADSAVPPPSFPANPKPTHQVDNESSMNSHMTQAAIERELHEGRKKEDEAMELKKFEVRCGLYPFRWYVFLTPS